jgi:hypothetical protein
MYNKHLNYMFIIGVCATCARIASYCTYELIQFAVLLQFISACLIGWQPGGRRFMCLITQLTAYHSGGNTRQLACGRLSTGTPRHGGPSSWHPGYQESRPTRIILYSSFRKNSSFFLNQVVLVIITIFC